MQNELSFLLKLQELDVVLDDLAEKSEAVAQRIQSKNQEIDSLKSSLKSAKEALSIHLVKKKQLEGEAEAKEQVLKKHQAALNALKSNDAYKAMLGEIEAAKNAVHAIEDEILIMMEQVEADDRDHKVKEQRVKAEEGIMRAAVQELENQKTQILAEKQTKQAARDAYVANVPAHLKNQYEVIRKKRGGMVVVQLVHGCCGGCQMTLTPNKANEVKKAKNMVVCESCSRIIYLAVSDSNPEAAAPPIPVASAPAPGPAPVPSVDPSPSTSVS